VTSGTHAEREDLPGRRRATALAFTPTRGLPGLPWAPGGLLNPATVAAFNEAWFRKAPSRREGELQRIGAFFHPLDGVRNWNRLYGPGGFVQYQLVVPFAAAEVVRTVVQRLSAARAASFLAVLKRFGPASPGPLSFPQPGWTFALDLPARTPGLGPLLDGLDDLVAGAGGRVYLAKDSRLRPDLLAAMYPRLDEWRELRSRIDPQRRFVSDLSRRLDL
jgi:decaprenylphospho-beta-D-ribofuranose 2-oxidase